MVWDPERPYDDLPPLPPPTVLETTVVLKSLIEARAALAQLDEAAARLPNPAVLLNAASILEAQASSEIENIVTTTDELFRLADRVDVTASREAKEALRYRQALFRGVAMLQSRPLTAATAAEVCTVTAARQMSVRNLPGTRIANPTTGEIVYSPPEGSDVITDKLANWERFLHADDGLDPLVRMAVAHYQFEAIHPFSDGNGRTGRILNILVLIEAGLITQPVLYLSRAIIATKNQYYARLLAVTRDGEWEPWVLYVLAAVRNTALSTLRKIDEIRALQERVRDEARDTVGGRNVDLLALLFEQPYCRITTVMGRCDVSRPTATGWLRALADRSVLREIKFGRDLLFVNWEFLDLLARVDDVTAPA